MFLKNEMKWTDHKALLEPLCKRGKLYILFIFNIALEAFRVGYMKSTIPIYFDDVHVIIFEEFTIKVRCNISVPHS